MIALAKIIIFLKRLLAAFFVMAIRPVLFLANFLFNKGIVKIYCRYNTFIKKIGWEKTRGNILSFLLNQKMVHLIVVLLTFFVAFSNFVANTKASVSERVRGTVLASIVQGEFGDLDQDYLIEETLDEESLMAPINQSYLEDGLAVVKNQPKAVIDSTEELADSGSVGALTQDSSAITKPEIASTKKANQSRKEIIKYTVEEGDTISTIAANFGISVNTILWENDLNAHSVIRPGQSLEILPISGVAYTVKSGDTLGAISNKYDIDEDKILAYNKMSNANQLKAGEKLIIPGGTKSSYSSVQKTSYSGVSAITSIVKSPSAKPVAGNKMNWPTQGARITQYYSWRHQGLDIANKTGTPLYAADAGTIEFVGWSNGYGNNIIINHGGGKKTRYAHLSKFYVKRGQSVSKGETIGAMGSTGWSTGPHLHFEVIINGVKYNPLNYIK